MGDWQMSIKGQIVHQIVEDLRVLIKTTTLVMDVSSSITALQEVQAHSPHALAVPCLMRKERMDIVTLLIIWIVEKITTGRVCYHVPSNSNTSIGSQHA